MKAIIKYVANDGTEFTEPRECEAHDALILEVGALMATLPAPPNDGAFANGRGFIQHEPAMFRAVRAALLRIAQRFSSSDWLQQSIDKGDEVDASWAGRVIGDGCPRPVEKAWYRIACTSRTTFREYGQPYFASHEAEAKQIRVNP